MPCFVKFSNNTLLFLLIPLSIAIFSWKPGIFRYDTPIIYHVYKPYFTFS